MVNETGRSLATESEIRDAIRNLRHTLESGSQLPNVWTFFSNKNKKLLTIQGDVPFIQSILLERDCSVQRYSIKSDDPRLKCDAGVCILAEYVDGSIEWMLCGRHSRILSNDKETVARVKLLAESINARFSLVTEKTVEPRLIEFQNWLTLSAALVRARDFSIEKETEAILHHLRSNSDSTFEEVMSFSGLDPALTIASVARLVMNGRVTCNLKNTPINKSTKFSITNCSERKESASFSRSAKESTPKIDSIYVAQCKRTARIPLEYRDLNKWPSVTPQLLRNEDVFRRNKQAIDMYVFNRSLSDIKKETGLGIDWIRNLFNKCLEIDSDGEIRGYRGLVKYLRIKRYQRVATLPEQNEFNAEKSGFSGAFMQLLGKYPEELTTLIESSVLKQRRGAEGVPESKISWRALQSQILSLLERKGVKKNEYPFNTRTKGYGAISTLGRSLLFKNPSKFIRARFGVNAARTSGIGKGYRPLIEPVGPYQILELDFHKLDTAATVDIETPYKGTISATIPRWWVGYVVETFSKAIISSSDSFEKQTTESCVLDLIDAAVCPPEALERLRSYSECRDGCWLPNQLMHNLAFHGWDILKLDRAWAHRGENVVSSLIATVGCVVCFSQPRAWWMRATVERSFLELTARCIQRLPTTTGSGPSDTRKNDPDKQALSLRFSRNEICDLVVKDVRRENESPKEGVFWESPLDCLRRCQSMDTYFPRPLPEGRRMDRPTQWVRVRAKIEANPSKGVAPCLRVHRTRYRGPNLASAWNLIGQSVQLEVCRKDIRIARVVRLADGSRLGSVEPERRWMKHQISWQSFLIIQKYGYYKKFANSVSDPVSQYLKEKGKNISDGKSPPSRIRKNSANSIDRVRNDVLNLDLEKNKTKLEETAGVEDENIGVKGGGDDLLSLLGSVPRVRSFSR